MTVGHLKKTILGELPQRFKCEPGDMQLFLAKRGNAWLPEDDNLEGLLQSGNVSSYMELLVSQKLADPTLFGSLGENVIHLLVQVVVPLVPSSTEVEIIVLYEDLQRKGVVWAQNHVEHQKKVKEVQNELEIYRQRGQVIKKKWPKYCQEVLDKVDEIYDFTPPLPFIYVGGSSGMGKSQLAFALQGQRPWFYWFAGELGVNSQQIYKNFFSVTSWFQDFVAKDLATVRCEAHTQQSNSSLYFRESLWTYGFIRALLNHIRMDEHYGARMIHFQEKTTLHVSKCNLKAVRAVCREMTQENKLLPFFILDEMAFNAGGGGEQSSFSTQRLPRLWTGSDRGGYGLED